MFTETLLSLSCMSDNSPSWQTLLPLKCSRYWCRMLIVISVLQSYTKIMTLHYHYKLGLFIFLIDKHHMCKSWHNPNTIKNCIRLSSLTTVQIYFVIKSHGANRRGRDFAFLKRSVIYKVVRMSNFRESWTQNRHLHLHLKMLYYSFNCLFLCCDRYGAHPAVVPSGIGPKSWERRCESPCGPAEE